MRGDGGRAPHGKRRKEKRTKKEKKKEIKKGAMNNVKLLRIKCRFFNLPIVRWL